MNRDNLNESTCCLFIFLGVSIIYFEPEKDKNEVRNATMNR